MSRAGLSTVQLATARAACPHPPPDRACLACRLLVAIEEMRERAPQGERDAWLLTWFQLLVEHERDRP